MMEKTRLDVLLVARGLAESRSLAQRLIMAGQVRVEGQVVLRASMRIANDSQVVVDQGPAYVSRGGEKLAAALAAFGLEDLTGLVCADIGASTGGFTDCLLQHGARHVFAVDVGYGELNWKLRSDPRVTVMERTNARYLAGFPQPVDLVTVDASFISLRILLPVIRGWFGEHPGRVVALIKPQFEAGRRDAARGEGVIRDPAVHRQVLIDVLGNAQHEGFGIGGLIRSPLLGPKGNVEFLVKLLWPANEPWGVSTLIEKVMAQD
jgi:23S rRNA (cytidine1920-2'-O)/16S rRNA (cytidine1409-2'-O)-methyltransferase